MAHSNFNKFNPQYEIPITAKATTKELKITHPRPKEAKQRKIKRRKGESLVQSTESKESESNKEIFQKKRS